MGCPFLGRPFDDNWGLPDPTGCDDTAFMDVIAEIEKNVLELKEIVEENEEEKQWLKTKFQKND